MGVIKSIIDFVMDILETIVFIGSLFIVIYLFIAAPSQVKGASMEPSFESGEYIMTSKITYKFRKPHRGDVIVFKSLKNPDIDYIKRIIGLPGDKIEIKNSDVFVNDLKLTEGYIFDKTNLWEGGFIQENVPIVVPEGSIFVMGDNRPRSSDSREFGPVPLDAIIGEVFYRYFPTEKMGWIKNPFPVDLQSFLLRRLKAFQKIPYFFARIV
ncbi:signal peptidase I [Candidatus Roizmanbacteria bacterium RIFCSPLOWO2_01_FULL_37_12]|uniref:Signal peptidase I n=1 Tax=Candidatus Roizmanbacteria bacterium RIFCSPLOWO2_01_FULL_37_12 TaxID=1802056 RepID=A0A1F7I7Z0_9BACT|nr:MAG: signal peptidase I [Candidatus Roizmanbacteria bacterium RIFCSPLOWO2_01_FULL_37_12]